MPTRKPLIQRKIWQIQEADPAVSEALAASANLPPLLARLLVSRGVTTAEAVHRYLNPDLADLHFPLLFEPMQRAVDRLQAAIDQNEKVCIYGDYDVDGMTSVSLLLDVFRHLGMQCDYYIPHRMEEGYGMNREAIEQIHSQGAQLVVSVDCGITSVAEIEQANELGMEVIVTDHHEPDTDHLPPAYALINPKLSEAYPFDGLAGVGIAFKLAHALAGGSEIPPYLYRQLDLVALGTVVDVTPLVDENRVLTYYGLQVLNQRERMGIRALCKVSNVNEESEIRTYTLGFVLGPRLNAAGRLDTARKAVELLTTDSPQIAQERAAELDTENTRRKEIELRIFEQAEAKIKKDVDLTQAKGIVLAEEGWHRGVIGIVASRIVERYHRPTVLIALEDDMGHGSGRSIETFNLYEGLAACQETMERFGGHKAAAGLSILRQNVPRLRYQFSKVTAERLTQEDLIPRLAVDVEATPDELSEELICEMARMEPFGLGNTKPVLAVRGAKLQRPAKSMGKTQDHLQFRIGSGQGQLRAVGWNMASYQILLREVGTEVDLAFYLEINEYQGYRNLQLNLRDLQIVREHEALPAQYPEDGTATAVLLDQRHVYDKIQYLRELIHRGEPVVIYVKSEAALDHFRRELGDTSAAYYERREPKEEREQALSRFNSRAEHVLVSSLTLVDVAPPQHIVFCHPVPTENMFFKRCEPAFRDGVQTRIHLIFHPRDIEVMHSVLKEQYPPRDILAQFYRDLRSLSRSGSTGTPLTDVQRHTGLATSTLRQGIAIFAELGFIDWNQDTQMLRLLPPPSTRVNLADSSTYQQGEHILQEALRFGDLLLHRSAKELWGLLQHANT